MSETILVITALTLGAIVGFLWAENRILKGLQRQDKRKGGER